MAVGTASSVSFDSLPHSVATLVLHFRSQHLHVAMPEVSG